jgi:transmembrane sensor
MSTMPQVPDTPPDVREPVEWSLVDRYLADDATPEQVTRLDAQLRAAPHVREILKTLRAWLGPAETPQSQNHGAAMWHRVATMVGLGSDESHLSHRPRVPASTHGVRTSQPLSRYPVGQPRALGIRRYMVSATIALALVLGSAALFHHRNAGVSTRAADRRYVTTTGQHAVVTFDDGSQAILGPATTLLVSAAPSTGTTVTVSGEAMFTVTHRTQSPFTVRAGNTLVRVLGTSFSVRRYPTDNTVRVAVADGRVSLRSMIGTTRMHEDLILAARMLAIVDDSGRARVTPNIAVDDYTAWTRGTLVFRQTPLPEMVADLGRAYGVDLRLGDSILNRRAFTWTVSVTRLTLDDVLDVLTGALHAHVTRSDSVITIVPGPPSRRKSVDPRFPPILENQYGR